MVTLENAARKLKLSLGALQDRLSEHGITIVGRGKRACISAADVERISRPITVVQPAPVAEEFARRRAETLWSLLKSSTAAKVVPFVRRPRK
jgi:pheromone shutdown protein TraB